MRAKCWEECDHEEPELFYIKQRVVIHTGILQHCWSRCWWKVFFLGLRTMRLPICNFWICCWNLWNTPCQSSSFPKTSTRYAWVYVCPWMDDFGQCLPNHNWILSGTLHLQWLIIDSSKLRAQNVIVYLCVPSWIYMFNFVCGYGLSLRQLILCNKIRTMTRYWNGILMLNSSTSVHNVLKANVAPMASKASPSNQTWYSACSQVICSISK